MKSRATGIVKKVWRDKENQWCVTVTLPNNRYIKHTHIGIPKKPLHKEGGHIRKGSEI